MNMPTEDRPAPASVEADGSPGRKAAGPAKRRAGPLAVAAAVFWSFFGIRRRKDYASDVESLTLPQVIIGGLIGAIVLVASLIGLVIFVTSK